MTIGKDKSVPHQELFERLGPDARLQVEISQVGSRNRDLWVITIFAAAVLALGAVSLISPASIWQSNEIEVMIPPQVLFLLMIVLVIVSLYFMRRETENRRLRMANLERTLAHNSERSAGLVDSVTNVFNRNFLHELLQGEIARAERNQRPLALVMCDINNFKRINDRYGHLMGDYVLAQVASILKYCVRGSDYIVRYGGDEFLVILPETEDTGAKIVLRRIHQKVSDWDQENRVGELPISVSLGLHHHVTGQAAEKDLAEADSRMYQAKQAAHANEAVSESKAK
jgi:diguanylate cyclase (GGDEF)-like protein